MAIKFGTAEVLLPVSVQLMIHTVNLHKTLVSLARCMQ